MRTGPGQVLLACYALFTLAAGARSIVQIVDRFDRAPLAYCLSGGAALLYLTASILIRAAITGRPVRRGLMVLGVIELVGVVVVGAASLLAPPAFPDATVWSHFGSGYGYVPVALPLAVLAWCRPVIPGRAGHRMQSSRRCSGD